MNKLCLVIFLLSICFGTTSCQTGCNLQGRWLIKKGTLTPNYRRTGFSYSQDQLTFFKNRLELASGFFYNILSLDSGDWALGRYPFVFYGNLESYKITNDSLKIYSEPYNTWESFKINCINSNEINLVTNIDTVILVRNLI